MRGSQVGRVEGFGKKIAHWDGFHFAFEIGEDDGDVAAEFPDDLAAGAARRSERIGVGDDGDGVEAAFAFANSLENSDTFRADGKPVGSVFNIAAAENAARGSA